MSLACFWCFQPKEDRSLNVDPASEPVVSVEYLPNTNTDYELRIERANRLQFSSQILALNNPEVESAMILPLAGYRDFADYNLLISSDKEQFFATASLLNTGVDPNNFVSEILENELYEKYLTLYPEQSYNVYFRLDCDAGYTPDRVIINNIEYPIKATSDQLYKLENFYASDFSAVGIRSTNKNYKISDAVFITGKIKQKNKKLRTTKDEARIKTNDQSNILSVSVPKDKFFVLKSVQNDFSLSPETVEVAPAQTWYVEYRNEPNLTYPSVETVNFGKVFFFTSGGDYKIVFESQKLDNSFLVTLGLILVIVYLIFQNKINLFGKTLLKWGAIILARTRRFIQANIVEIFSAALVVVIALIFQFNPHVSKYLTTTNLLMLSFVLTLVIIRFNFQVIKVILASFLLLVAFLVQFGFINLAEKIGILIFWVILIVAILLLLQIKNEKRNEKKRKN